MYRKGKIPFFPCKRLQRLNENRWSIFLILANAAKTLEMPKVKASPRSGTAILLCSAHHALCYASFAKQSTRHLDDSEPHFSNLNVHLRVHNQGNVVPVARLRCIARVVLACSPHRARNKGGLLILRDVHVKLQVL